ncbi:MAG: phosphoglycerate kinase, partial [bacterium]|nr:phosphoglycerate kinase [bacterium]
AKAIIESGAFSIIGGGETIEFINRIGLVDKFSHVSTGGGAMLAFLAGEKLPGIEVLKWK